MAVATQVSALKKINVATGVPIAVAIPVNSVIEIFVTYGREALPLVLNTDYTVTLLDPSNFDTFTLTPLAPMLSKINALIVLDPTESNYITIRRTLDYLTESSEAYSRYTTYLSQQHDKTIARFQQVQEQLNRSLLLADSVLGSTRQLTLSDLEVGRALVVGPTTGQIRGNGPSLLDIEAAAENAAIATQAANTALQAAASASAALAGLVPSFQTYALAKATVLPLGITTARMLGYYSAGDCLEFLVKRVGSQPSHNAKFRSDIDRYLADGITSDNTNGGWWEFQLASTVEIAQCGARRHSTLDSAVATNNAVGYIQAKYGYGSVFFSPSNAPWTIASMVENAVCPVTYYSNNQDTAVHCGPNDITIFKLTQKRSMIRDLTIYGKGCSNLPLADNSFGVSKPTVHIPAGSVNTVIDHCIINGGTECVRWEGGDCKIYRCEMENAYGVAQVWAFNTGSGWMHRCALDQKWHQFPGYQSQPATIPDWAPTTAYVLGDIRKTNGFLIQCRPSALTGTGGPGTSGAVAPTLKNYLVDIADGTVNWLLLAPTVYSSFIADTGSSEISLLQMDLSGPFDYSVKLRNSNPLAVGSPAAPQYIDIGFSTISAAFLGGVLLSAGRSFRMMGVHGGGGVCADSAAVRVSSGFIQASIHDNEIQGGAYGLDCQGGSRIFFTKNWVDLTPAGTGVAQAVRIRNTASVIHVKDNDYGGSTLAGTLIDAGTGNDIHVCDNTGPALATLCVDNRPGKLRSVIRETH